MGVEEVDIVSNHAYKYPPRSGNYFGSHFIMGGERFDTPQPEAYLFGENVDLNFLGNRPTPVSSPVVVHYVSVKFDEVCPVYHSLIMMYTTKLVLERRYFRKFWHSVYEGTLRVFLAPSLSICTVVY